MINKLKILSLAICCSIVVLWSEAQCAEKPREERVNLGHQQTSIPSNIPIGGIIVFTGESPPDGWLPCNGQQYSNQLYPQLYEVVKEKYVPDNSWVIEANKRSQLEKYFCVPDLRGDPQTRNTGSVGANQLHNNIQPCICLNYIINTGKSKIQHKLDVQNKNINQLEKQKAEKIDFWSSGLDKDLQHLKDIESYDWKILEAIKIYYTSEAVNKFNGDINIGFDKEELRDIFEIHLLELFISNTFIHNHYLYSSSYKPLLSGHSRPIPVGEMWSYCYVDLCKFYLKSIINKKMENYRKLKGTDHFLRGQV